MIQSSYTAGYLGAFILGAATVLSLRTTPVIITRPILSAALRVSCLLSLPNTIRRGILWNRPLQFRHRSVRLVSDRLWSVRVGDARGGIQPVYWHGRARRDGLHALWQQKCRASLQSLYGHLPQTRQGSSPTAQWGSSYVSRGNQSASHSITRPQTDRWGRFKPRRAERRLLRALPGEIRPWARPPAATCMPGTTGMFTRTRAPVAELRQWQLELGQQAKSKFLTGHEAC